MRIALLGVVAWGGPGVGIISGGTYSLHQSVVQVHRLSQWSTPLVVEVPLHSGGSLPSLVQYLLIVCSSPWKQKNQSHKIKIRPFFRKSHLYFYLIKIKDTFTTLLNNSFASLASTIPTTSNIRGTFWSTVIASYTGYTRSKFDICEKVRYTKFSIIETNKPICSYLLTKIWKGRITLANMQADAPSSSLCVWNFAKNDNKREKGASFYCRILVW